MGSNKSTTKGSSTTQPLDWQENAIKGIFNDANNLYNTQQAPSNFNTYVGLNGTQNNALNDEISASGSQASAGAQTQNAGTALLNNAGAGSAALQGTSDIAAGGALGNFNQGSTATSDAAQGATGSYTGAALSNLYNAAGLSGTDATAQNEADAENYANSSGVQNAIKAANAYSDQLYQRTTGTNMNAAAVAGGNLNSSRAGAASAVSEALQNAQDANTAASMENSAYQTGLSTAEQAREANLSGALSGASTGLSGVNTGLSAQNDSNSQVNADNSTQQGYLNELGSAGNALVNSATQGSDLENAGATLTNTANSNALNAGTAYQDAATQQNEANLQAQEAANQYPWTQLQNLYGIEGASNWGSQTNSQQTTTSTPSLGSVIQGAIGGLAGLGSAVATGGATEAAPSLMNLFSSPAKSGPNTGSVLYNSYSPWAVQ